MHTLFLVDDGGIVTVETVGIGDTFIMIGYTGTVI